MKYILLLLFLLPVVSFAQDNPFYMPPPAGKARIVVLYDNYENWQRVVPVTKESFFINAQLKCRLKEGTYTYFDVEPGTYFLAAEVTGKKLNKRTPQTELRALKGKIYCFEMEGVYEGLRSVIYVSIRNPVELEKLMKRRRTVFIEDCKLTKPAAGDRFENKSVFVRIPIGITIPAGNYKNWWPAQSRPFVNRFQPLTPGFEIGVKLGANNHFISWGYANNRQPTIVNTANSTMQEYISINFNTLYYAYGFALNASNKCLLYPKAGVSFLNYIQETRLNGSGGSIGVGRFGTNLGLQFEYRISRTFSADISWEYLNGRITFEQEKINLNQHRLAAGVRAQF
jgi:hypothetical protein